MLKSIPSLGYRWENIFTLQFFQALSWLQKNISLRWIFIFIFIIRYLARHLFSLSFDSIIIIFTVAACKLFFLCLWLSITEYGEWVSEREEKNQPALCIPLPQKTTHEFSYYWECIECDSRQNKKVNVTKNQRVLSHVEENLIENENIKKKNWNKRTFAVFYLIFFLLSKSIFRFRSSGIEWA